MIRVAFVLEAHSWLGGISYYRNLISALALLSPRQIQPVVFLGADVSDEIAANYSDAELIRTTLLDRNSPYGLVRRVVRKLARQRDFLLGQLLRRHSVQVLSHYPGRLPKRSRIATISWIPDFQHVHLPDYFSPTEQEARRQGCKRLVEQSDLLIVSSNTALKDVARLYPTALPKSAVLRFVPRVDCISAPTPIAALKARYNFEGEYFFLPNQFWAHKNHQVVIDALSILKKNGIQATVLATGDFTDYRQPNHFSELLSKVSQLGVSDAFRPLGVVPYVDLLSLMHHSLAVINPSMFEGWSTTVEEAKALNKAVILSNIPVHLEQCPARPMFFEPQDPLALSRLMQEMLNRKPIHSTAEEQDGFTLSSTYPRDRLKFASDFQEIVLRLAR